MKNSQPDYRIIYTDILAKHYPKKISECERLLAKSKLSVMDIVELNKRIFGASYKTNQKYRSYRKSDILKILNYQKKHKLNNSQLANHFKLSRNTVAKWRKLFVV